MATCHLGLGHVNVDVAASDHGERGLKVEQLWDSGLASARLANSGPLAKDSKHGGMVVEREGKEEEER